MIFSSNRSRFDKYFKEKTHAFNIDQTLFQEENSFDNHVNVKVMHFRSPEAMYKETKRCL